MNEIKQYNTVWEQFGLRKKAIDDFIENAEEYIEDVKDTLGINSWNRALTKPGDKKTAYVFYDVLNQYGESVRLSTTISWSSSAKSITADKTTGMPAIGIAGSWMRN